MWLAAFLYKENARKQSQRWYFYHISDHFRAFYTKLGIVLIIAQNLFNMNYFRAGVPSFLIASQTISMPMATTNSNTKLIFNNGPHMLCLATTMATDQST